MLIYQTFFFDLSNQHSQIYKHLSIWMKSVPTLEVDETKIKILQINISVSLTALKYTNRIISSRGHPLYKNITFHENSNAQRVLNVRFYPINERQISNKIKFTNIRDILVYFFNKHRHVTSIASRNSAVDFSVTVKDRKQSRLSIHTIFFHHFTERMSRFNLFIFFPIRTIFYSATIFSNRHIGDCGPDAICYHLSCFKCYELYLRDTKKNSLFRNKWVITSTTNNLQKFNKYKRKLCRWKNQIRN